MKRMFCSLIRISRISRQPTESYGWILAATVKAKVAATTIRSAIFSAVMATRWLKFMLPPRRLRTRDLRGRSTFVLAEKATEPSGDAIRAGANDEAERTAFDGARSLRGALESLARRDPRCCDDHQT